MSRAADHHRPCACGAELADECATCASSNPFGSMRLDTYPNPAERGWFFSNYERPETQETP